MKHPRTSDVPPRVIAREDPRDRNFGIFSLGELSNDQAHPTFALGFLSRTPPTRGATYREMVLDEMP